MRTHHTRELCGPGVEGDFAAHSEMTRSTVQPSNVDFSFVLGAPHPSHTLLPSYQTTPVTCKKVFTLRMNRRRKVRTDHRPQLFASGRERGKSCRGISRTKDTKSIVYSTISTSTARIKHKIPPPKVKETLMLWRRPGRGRNESNKM